MNPTCLTRLDRFRYGRQLVPVFYDIKSSDGADTNQQNACTVWTSDHPVFAVAHGFEQLNGDLLYDCLAKHHVPLFNMVVKPRVTKDLARYPANAYVNEAGMERLAETWV